MRKIADETKPVGCKVPVEMHSALDKMADNTGVGIAWHIRKALDEYIERNQKLLKKAG